MPLPEEVFVSQGETLPRRLVQQCAKRGCRRCGGQGWYRFAGTQNAWVCPCAQSAVGERVSQARAHVHTVKPLEALARAVKQMLEQQLVPAVLLCSAGIGRELRDGVPDGPKLPRPWLLQVASDPEVTLEVFEDDDAPSTFARVFTAEEFLPFEKELRVKWAAKVAAAQREGDASAELAKLRAELVKPL